MEAPVVLVVGRKVQDIVFADPRSNMNFITHKLAHQLQLEGTCLLFMKRVNEDYTEREVKVYRLSRGCKEANALDGRCRGGKPNRVVTAA